VSDLCEEHRINPTLFYRWQKDWFEQGAVVFDAGRATYPALQPRTH
jgi:transposase-like protein